jgi:polysaccharide biosynthesis transport protein
MTLGTILLVVIGVLVLLAVALRAIGALRPRVTTAADVEGSTGLVVLGALSGRFRGRPVVSMNGRAPQPAVEGLERICRLLERNGLGTGIKTLTVVPAAGGRERSTFATDLATTLAAEGRSVLLVLANLRQLGRWPDAPPPGHKGLAELLEGDRSNPVTLLISVAEHLLVLPSGRSERDPASLLAKPALGEVIGALRSLGLIAIIDAPPASFAADVLPLARQADATLLIVPAGSGWRQVEEAARTLRHGEAGDPAAVLVGTRRRASLAVGVPRPGLQTGGGV